MTIYNIYINKKGDKINMNKNNGTKDNIIWNIVAFLSMMAIITFCSVELHDMNVLNIKDGGEAFLYVLGIITASIVLIWNLYRIYLKFPKEIMKKNNQNTKKK